MNFHERQSLINTTNNGNHIAGEPDYRDALRDQDYQYSSEEDDLVQCPNCPSMTSRQRIDSTGECEDCEERFWERKIC